MASFWDRLMQLLDRLLGEPPSNGDDMDPVLVERAIKAIQTHVDEERVANGSKRLRVSDLSPESRARLTNELARIIRHAKDGKLTTERPRAPVADGGPHTSDNPDTE